MQPGPGLVSLGLVLQILVDFINRPSVLWPSQGGANRGRCSGCKTVCPMLNRFCMEQGHCGACRKKWRLTDTDLCPCGETQMMSHIVESCPLTKLNGGLSRLHSADEDAVSWLTSYGSWNAYEKKKKCCDTVGWVVWPEKSSTKLPIMYLEGR